MNLEMEMQQEMQVPDMIQMASLKMNVNNWFVRIFLLFYVNNLPTNQAMTNENTRGVILGFWYPTSGTTRLLVHDIHTYSLGHGSELNIPLLTTLNTPSWEIDSP